MPLTCPAKIPTGFGVSSLKALRSQT